VLKIKLSVDIKDPIMNVIREDELKLKAAGNDDKVTDTYIEKVLSRMMDLHGITVN
jgi:hypothetical protein